MVEIALSQAESRVIAAGRIADVGDYSQAVFLKMLFRHLVFGHMDENDPAPFFFDGNSLLGNVYQGLPGKTHSRNAAEDQQHRMPERQIMHRFAGIGDHVLQNIPKGAVVGMTGV